MPHNSALHYCPGLLYITGLDGAATHVSSLRGGPCSCVCIVLPCSVLSCSDKCNVRFGLAIPFGHVPSSVALDDIVVSRIVDERVVRYDGNTVQ